MTKGKQHPALSFPWTVILTLEAGFVCLPETCPRPSCCGQSKNHLWREYLKTGLTSSLPQEPVVKLQLSSDTENSTIRWMSQIWVSVYLGVHRKALERRGLFHLLLSNCWETCWGTQDMGITEGWAFLRLFYLKCTTFGKIQSCVQYCRVIVILKESFTAQDIDFS